MASRIAAAAAVGAAALAAGADAKVFLREGFDSEASMGKWTPSEWKGEDQGKWERSAGEWFADEAKDQGLMATEDMRWYTISAPMDATVSTKDSDLVLQFSVKHAKKEYAFCGGGYIKLMPKGTDAKTLGGDTPYHIMFGPDLCGYDISRIHAIFNYNGDNLLKDDEIKLDYNEKDEYTHVYTLVLKTDNSYQILFDGNVKAEGDISDAWAFPSKEIDDPEDKKPADWVDAAEIEDDSVTKPEGYDDIPATIADPDAKQPDDWDEEEDGEWEAPEVPNPEFKGPWVQPMKPNPDYKGEWSPAQIANKDYAPDTYAKYGDIGVVAFEEWIVNAGSIFDNILVTDDLAEAEKERKAILDNAEKEKEAKEAWKKANEPEVPEEEEFADDEEDEDEVEVEVAKDEL
jgi:calreticulin